MNRQLATVLVQSARARAMSSRELASQLHLPLNEVHDTMAVLASNATGRDARNVTMHPSLTFDHVIAQMGRASASPTVNGRSAPIRRIHVLRPSVLGYSLTRMRNARMWRTPWVKRWMQDGGSGLMLPVAYNAPDAGAPPSSVQMPGTPGVYRSSPDAQWWHTVQAGDSPALVAKWITGNGNLSGPGNYTEFIDANPSRPTVGTRGTWSFNFKSFMVGDKFLIPKSWNQYISQSGDWGTYGVPYPVGPLVAAPSGVGTGTPDATDYSSSLPAGKIAALKVELGAWGTNTGKNPGYPGPFDLTDVIDEPFHAAVQKFQLWNNANAGTSLRTDGRLDKPTADAIDSYITGKVASPAPAPAPAPASPVFGTSWIPGLIAAATPPAPSPVSTDLHPDIPGAGGTWKWIDGMYRFYPSGSSTPTASVADKSLITKPSSSSSSGDGVVIAGLALAAAKLMHFI